MGAYILLGFHWQGETQTVRLILVGPPTGPIELTLPVEDFFAMCDMVSTKATAFIELINTRLASGDKSDYSVELGKADIDKLMDLKDKYEDKGEDDEKRA